MYGVVSRRTGRDRYAIEVEALPRADEAELLSYLRRQVRIDPAEWIVFRSDHLGGEGAF